MKISKWMKGLLAFLLSFSVMFTTMIQQSVVRAEEGGVDPVEVIEEETPASSPEAAPTAEAVEAQTVSEPAAAAEETAEPAVQPAETPAVQETAPPTESTSVPEEQVQTVKETPVVTQEEAPAETQAYVSPASFDAEQDNIKVHADTAEGAFSEPVTLIVSLLDEDSDDYKKVQETMDQTGSSVDGLLALDIRFENSSGQEVEPVGQVSVSVVMKDAANEDIDQSSLQVTHLKEEADGSLTPEKVADNDENTEGYIRTAGNDIQADFVAESFSTFVISRAKGTSSKTYFTDTYGTPIAENDNLTRDQAGSNLTTVNTVDSMSKGFHIYLVDMDELWNYGIGSYKSTGMLSQGIYGRTLRNQYPYFVANGTSLRSEFANKTEVNHLFYESTYSATGYFYFNSAETFASLQSNGTFLVSRELGSPSSESAFYYQRGNFLPYNSLNLNRVINHNLYDDQGNPLSPSAPRYNENLYRMNQEVNYGFGMHATAEFYQPVNGQVNGGEDMVYEFTGDDDMLVYIDGVLVLDLGGIHDAQSGSINFRTGTVTYTNINNKDNRDYGSSTTIRNQFELARQLGSTTWSGNTFAAGTSHKIDIFYMERGAGASNLKMKVNIPPVPDGSVAVTKQVEGLDASQATEETYTMKLFVNGTVATNKQYTMSDNPAEQLTTDAEGRFSLKAGQTAMFSSIGANNTVRVEEIADEDTIYDVSYQRYDSNGNAITDSNDTITVPSAGHVAVTVKNDAADHTRDLTITKQFMMNGQDVSGVIDMAAFQNATFKLQESKDNGSNWKDLYTISYSSFTDGSYTFSQLDPRKIYRVIENVTNETNGTNAAYSYAGTVSAVNNETGDTTSPIISLRDGNATVSFINSYETHKYPLTIKKIFTGVDSLPETFEITDQNGRKYTLKDKDVVKQDNTYTWTGTADFGTEFQLREGNAEIHGYDLASTVNGQNGTSGTLQITTGENKIVFHNDYKAQSKTVTVTKQFSGLSAEEIPAGFAITGLGEDLTVANAKKTGDFTYQWTRDVAYGTNLTLSETGYAVSGYQVAAAVNGKPGTGIELTVGDDNSISFVNSYDKKYSEDDVNTPSFTIHKVNQDGKLLAGAAFTLTDSNNNVVWTGTTDGKNDLTADFANFDFGTDPSAKFSFTLHEDAPVGYTGAEDWTITVSEDDGVVSLRKESDEDFFHKIYNWLIKDSFDKAYDQTSKVLTVTNTVNSYDFTVTKSFTGVEALPEDFQIRDSLGNVYKLDDKNVQTVNGVYTWTGTAKYKTEITFTEYNFDVDGYSVKSTANGSNGTSNKLTVTADPAKNTMAFNNVYTANTYDVIVTKGYTGIDALPDTFKITGVGNEVFTIDNAVSGTGTLSDPYVWTAKAVYGTTLKIQESGYAVSGYTTVAAVNGKAGDVTEIKVNTKDNTVAFTNSYVMNFSDANDVTKPGFILHKVDQNGKALAGAGFTLYDQNNNVVWSGTTAADGVLSVNFDSFDFGENAKAVHTFTLCETSVPEGYTGAADLTLTVKEDDGKVDLVKKDGEDYYHKVYHWVIADGLGRNYDAASNILTVTNTAIVYPFTILKTFSGVDALPDTFVITDQNGNQYTLNDAAKQGNTYTWTGNADYGTEFRLTESGMAVHGYDLASTVNGQIETSGTLKVTAEEKNNVITFSNAYTAQPRTITVTKQFNGLTDEEVPTGFAITGLGEDLTLENAEKTGDFTYQWTRDVAYGTNLTLSETGYAVSGYQVATAVNSKPGTGIELTVGDDNSISFVNSYDKKYSEDDVNTPSFTIHKVDQDGKLLAGAAFTLTDSNNNVVWTGTTDGENDLTADFANFDFGTDPSAKFSFTLHEDAPVGYTGAEDWTIIVSEDDGVVSLRKESDEDFFHKIYNWLIKDSFDKAYDQTSKVLTVTNTVNSYDFTVTKSFTGVEALPEDFQIRDSLGNVYTLDDAKSANGTYTWTGKADYGTKVTFTENSYEVNGYDVTTSVNGKDGTSAEITIGTSNNNVDFVNSYEAGTYMVRVTKSFTGVDELPDTFAITGAGENALTAADAVSGTGAADDPYVWNVEAKFGTILNIAETGYETEGYDVTATVNGNAGTSMQIQVGTGSNNVAFNNAYSLKKTDVILTASKNLTGRDLKAGEFSFEAYEGDQLVAEGTNDADGNITFSTIHDVTYGSHTYTLKEVNQGLGGMTYDDNAYEVTVEVIDQDGTAKAVLPETKPVFTNTYSAQDGSAVIEARKNLRGREAVNGEFSFELLQDGQVIATAVNEDGGVVFGPISWTMDEVGTYTYTIRETAGKDKNVVYDSHEETVTVTVSDNGDGTLLIETAYDKDGAVFENMYEPPVPHTDDDPKPSPEPSAPPSSDPSPVPAVPHTDDNGKTTGSSRTPQTGVSTDVTTWVWLGSSSLLALFIALILRRRKEESK